MKWMVGIAIGVVLNTYCLTDAHGVTVRSSSSKLCESVLSSFQDRLSRGLRGLLKSVRGSKKVTLFLLVTPKPTSNRLPISDLVEKHGIESLSSREAAGESNYLEIRGTKKAVLELLGAIQSLETDSGVPELEWAGLGLRTIDRVPRTSGIRSSTEQQPNASAELPGLQVPSQTKDSETVTVGFYVSMEGASQHLVASRVRNLEKRLKQYEPRGLLIKGKYENLGIVRVRAPLLLLREIVGTNIPDVQQVSALDGSEELELIRPVSGATEEPSDEIERNSNAAPWKPSRHVQTLFEEEEALRPILNRGAEDDVQVDVMFHQDNSRRSNSVTITPDHPRYQWWQEWLMQQFSNQAEGGLPYITAIPYLEALYGTELQLLLSEGIEILKPETQSILFGAFGVRGKLRSVAKVLDRFPRTLPIPPGWEPDQFSFGALPPEPGVELVHPNAIRVPKEVDSVLKSTDPKSITTISLMFNVKSDWEMFQSKANESGGDIVLKIILGDEAPYLATVEGRSGPLFDLLSHLKESELGAVTVELPPLRGPKDLRK